MNTQTVGTQHCCAPTHTMCNQPDLISMAERIKSLENYPDFCRQAIQEALDKLENKKYWDG